MKKEAVADKKKILSEEYGIVMRDDTERRLNTMCNLSEAVLEKGIEKGISFIAKNMKSLGFPVSEISKATGLKEEDINSL